MVRFRRSKKFRDRRFGWDGSDGTVSGRTGRFRLSEKFRDRRINGGGRNGQVGSYGRERAYYIGKRRILHASVTVRLSDLAVDPAGIRRNRRRFRRNRRFGKNAPSALRRYRWIRRSWRVWRFLAVRRFRRDSAVPAELPGSRSSVGPKPKVSVSVHTRGIGRYLSSGRLAGLATI